ncbi:MAG TPA: hypothetical protein VLL49_02890 [Anaerolineales bacterium]|nr:hypothetical protein [Anaerolineales bacterium]
MNQSPWQVENAARYERERIAQDMTQLRLEQRARAGRIKRRQPMVKIWMLIRGWFQAGQKRGADALRHRPARATQGGRQIGI